MPSLSSTTTLLSPEYIAIGLLVVAVLILAVWVMKLEHNIKKIVGGGKPVTIEEALATLHAGHKDFRSFEKQINTYLKSAETRLRKSIQRIETIRFNPFKGTGDGGNQSFATAFINEDGDGIIISSMYARDRMSIFTKPISKFASPFELTAEERQVLEKIRTSFTTP